MATILNRTLFIASVIALGAGCARVDEPSTDRASSEVTTSVLVPAGATWRYLDDGSNQGTAWRAASFNDAAWSQGPAQLGYGDGDEATAVSFGPSSSAKFITTYFRRAFNVADPGALLGLNVRLLRDDGAVVYLNGVEVARSNMPAGTIAHTTRSSGDAGCETCFEEHAIATGNVVAGVNVIAVELHQSEPASSDISFDLELQATIQDTFVPAGSVWRFLDNGSDQGTAWRAVSFNDGTWRTGAAQLGYGDGDEATLVSFGPSSSAKFITTYFRRTFNVTDPSAHSGLALRLLRDDGAVVYLNGAEVVRSNMPAGTITHTTRSAADAGCETCFEDHAIAASHLVAGANVVAVELHQSDATSSDISFDLELKPAAGGGGPSCGDDTCNGTETCSACPADCGTCPPPPPEGDYFVAPNGLDSNPGTSAAPFRTIQKAANVVNPGDVVIVRDGTYTGVAPGTSCSSGDRAHVCLSRGGTPGNLVTFRAEHPLGAKIDGQKGVAYSGFAFRANHIRVEGFELFGFENDGSSGAMYLYNGGTGSHIVGNFMHDIGRLCTDTSNGQVGIFAKASDLVIERNHFFNIGRLATGEQGCVNGNQFFTNHDHGIYMDGQPSNVIIRNNIFRKIQAGWAIQLWNGTLTGFTIVNNTFLEGNPHSGKAGYFVFHSATLRDLVIRNNIFDHPRDAVINAQSCTDSSQQSCSLKFFNFVFTNNLTTEKLGGGTAALSGVTHVGLTAGPGNLFNSNPLFVSSSDFHVQAGSPAIDAGANLGSVVPNDFDGVSRPRGGGFDIGAFERP